jgi:hypothetical protein
VKRHFAAAQTGTNLRVSRPQGIAAPLAPHVEGGNLNTRLISTSCQSWIRPDSLVFTYKGWNVDASRAAAVQPPERSMVAICRQIDIVEDVGLSPDILRFMRSVRFWIDPLRMGGGPGHYARTTGVDFHVRQLDPDKPIALHELLHAYHDQCLGFDNPAILKFYQAALERSDWPRDAQMLKNAPEFFSMTGSAHLFRNIPRPPFSAERLKKTDPEYYAWLSTLLHHARAPFSEYAAPSFGPAHSSAVP